MFTAVLCEPFYLQVLCYGQKGIELLLGNVNLSVVHEVEDRLQVSELHPLEVEERVLVGVLPEDGPEEGGAGGQDELVCLDLSGSTAQGTIKEVFLLSDLPEGDANVAFKIIPAETKLLTRTHH